VSRYDSVDGVRVHSLSAGVGPPLLLLHDLFFSSRSWERVLPALAARWWVIAVDLPGFGESDRPAQYPYTVESFAHTMTTLLDALGVSQVSLLGHSLGGAVALRLADQLPERVQRAVAVSPLLPPLALPLEGRLVMLPVVGEFVFHNLFSRRDLARFLRREVYLDPALPEEEALQFYWERLNRPGGREAAYRTLEALAHPHPEAPEPRARCPVRLIWGAQDRLVPRARLEQLAAALPAAQLAMLEGAAHAPMEERPEAFCELVLPFLAGEG